jgi:predicted transglutaminase-like cysteine proteinase
MKVEVFNKNYSNETEEVTKTLRDVNTPINTKIIKTGDIAWGVWVI